MNLRGSWHNKTPWLTQNTNKTTKCTLRCSNRKLYSYNLFNVIIIESLRIQNFILMLITTFSTWWIYTSYDFRRSYRIEACVEVNDLNGSVSIAIVTSMFHLINLCTTYHYFYIVNTYPCSYFEHVTYYKFLVLITQIIYFPIPNYNSQAEGIPFCILHIL